MADIHTRLKIENTDTTIYPVCDYNDMINKPIIPTIPTIPQNIVTFEPVGNKAQLKSTSGATLDPVTSASNGNTYQHNIMISGTFSYNGIDYIFDGVSTIYTNSNVPITNNNKFVVPLNTYLPVRGYGYKWGDENLTDVTIPYNLMIGDESVTIYFGPCIASRGNSMVLLEVGSTEYLDISMLKETISLL